MDRTVFRSAAFVVFVVSLIALAQTGRPSHLTAVERQDSYSVREELAPQPLSLTHRIPYARVVTRFVEQEEGDFLFIEEEPEQKPILPDIRDARSALVYNVASGEDIFAFNEIQRWPIASLSKLMVALLSFEKFDMTSRVAITRAAVSTEGAAGDLASGGIYSVRDLVNAIMIASSNDAAVSLAEFYGYQNFMALMNTRAKELGMVQTYFDEPSGLSVLNQSSADDLKRLTLYIYENHPEIFLISQKQTTRLHNYATGEYHAIRNVNRYANASQFLGGKTGYIDESRQNLISFFSRNNKPILVIILGSTNRYAVGDNVLAWLDSEYFPHLAQAE
jgi:D-alanyl-D-alanine carboxypeptidase